ISTDLFSSYLPTLLCVLSSLLCVLLFFFFNDTATTEIYTLSLHDALPICASWPTTPRVARDGPWPTRPCPAGPGSPWPPPTSTWRHRREPSASTWVTPPSSPRPSPSVSRRWTR